MKLRVALAALLAQKNKEKLKEKHTKDLKTPVNLVLVAVNLKRPITNARLGGTDGNHTRLIPRRGHPAQGRPAPCEYIISAKKRSVPLLDIPSGWD
jgi:hypothetical protein